MTKLLCIHPKNPQARLIHQVVVILNDGGVVILPTDSGYSLCCALGQQKAVERIRCIRQLDEKHFFTLFCRDFSDVSIYAQINNQAFRFLKAHLPAPMTFILPATKEVPRQLLHPNRRTVGIRIPEHPILMQILADFSEPLMSVSVDSFPETWPLLDPEIIFSKYQKKIEIMVDGGPVAVAQTTVVNLVNGLPEIVRQGSYYIMN